MVKISFDNRNFTELCNNQDWKELITELRIEMKNGRYSQLKHLIEYYWCQNKQALQKELENVKLKTPLTDMIKVCILRKFLNLLKTTQEVVFLSKDAG